MKDPEDCATVDAFGHAMHDPWQAAMIDALCVAGIYTREHDTDPRRALHDLIAWEVTIALDPSVSSGAQELIQRGRDEAKQEQSK